MKNMVIIWHFKIQLWLKREPFDLNVSLWKCTIYYESVIMILLQCQNSHISLKKHPKVLKWASYTGHSSSECTWCMGTLHDTTIWKGIVMNFVGRIFFEIIKFYDAPFEVPHLEISASFQLLCFWLSSHFEFISP